MAADAPLSAVTVHPCSHRDLRHGDHRPSLRGGDGRGSEKPSQVPRPPPKREAGGPGGPGSPDPGPRPAPLPAAPGPAALWRASFHQGLRHPGQVRVHKGTEARAGQAAGPRPRSRKRIDPNVMGAMWTQIKRGTSHSWGQARSGTACGQAQRARWSSRGRRGRGRGWQSFRGGNSTCKGPEARG